jgi:hypothetical protein
MTPQKELMIHYTDEEEQFVAVLEQCLINQFSGDEIVSKFEFFESHHWKIERVSIL